jgi:hypothetical protein
LNLDEKITGVHTDQYHLIGYRTLMIGGQAARKFPFIAKRPVVFLKWVYAHQGWL